MRLSDVEKQAIVVALSEVLAGPGLQGYEDDPAEEARLLAAMWRAHEKLAAEFGRCPEVNHAVPTESNPHPDPCPHPSHGADIGSSDQGEEGRT